MKFENNLYWPNSETHLNSFGLSYQSRVREVGISFVPPSKRNIAVDIGAHVGIASIHFADHFRSVLAFEPIPETFECLQANLEKHKKVNVSSYNLALADKERFISFKTHEGNTGYTEPEVTPTVTPDIATKTTTLDDALNGLKPDLIKIDVEGFEPLVISGGIKTINKCKPVIIIEAKGIGFSKPDPHNAIRTLVEAGYKVVGQESHDYILVHIDNILNKTE